MIAAQRALLIGEHFPVQPLGLLKMTAPDYPREFVPGGQGVWVIIAQGALLIGEHFPVELFSLLIAPPSFNSSGQDVPSSQVRAVIDVKAGSRYYDGVGELLGSRWVPTVQ